MVFFLAFLVLSTIILPAVALSRLGRIGLSLCFSLMIILGVFATIRHRAAIWLVVVSAVSSFAVDCFMQFSQSQNLTVLDTSLRIASLLIMFFVTMKRTLRPGRINGYRVLGGIAGYLIIGLTWTFAYQLVRRGSRYGVRVIGTLKRGQDINVLAIYER